MATTGFYFDPNRTADYFILVKNPQKQYVGLIDSYNLLDYTIIENKKGALLAEVPQSIGNDLLAQIENGWAFEVQRKILGQLPTIDFDNEYIINNSRTALTQAGIVYRFGGTGLNSLLSGRKVAYRTTTPQATKTGIATTLINEMVVENLGTGADNVDRLIDAQIDPAFFQVAADPVQGPVITPKNLSTKGLINALTDVVNQSASAGTRLIYRVKRLNQDKVEFQVAKDFIGTDHGFNSRQAITLSEEMGTLVDVSITTDDTRSFNVEFTGGGGDNLERLFGIASDSVSRNQGPYAQKEHYSDARKKNDQTTLNNLAAQGLELGQARIVLEATIPTYGGVQWGDIGFGDRVIIGAGGQSFDGRISAARVTLRNNDVNVLLGMKVNL